MTQTIPSTEPFFFPGTSTNSTQVVGCLLVHGFTGTPKEMRWMGEYLNKQGFAVLGVRLAGHATHPEDMTRSNYTDWLASLEDGFQLLQGAAQHIYLIGLSMGGSLVLRIAPYLPVRGVITMAACYKLPDDWRLNYIGIISKIMPYMPKRHKAEPNSGWFDLDALKSHISYPQHPVRSIGQFNQLLGEMRAILPQVKTPALLMHSRNDTYVLPENMPAIHRDLGSTDKQMLWLENSGHVVTRDAQRETVFKAAADFIRKIENGSHVP